MTNPYEENEKVSKALVQVVQQISDTADLTQVLKPTSVGENLKDLHERLLTVRARQQRLSELVGTLIRIQGRMRKEVLQRELDLSVAEAHAAHSKQMIMEDYSSAKERTARMMAKTLDEHVALNAAKQLQANADAALAYAQNAHRELGNQAYDVRTRVKVLEMEGTLGGS